MKKNDKNKGYCNITYNNLYFFTYCVNLIQIFRIVKYCDIIKLINSNGVVKGVNK